MLLLFITLRVVRDLGVMETQSQGIQLKTVYMYMCLEEWVLLNPSVSINMMHVQCKPPPFPSTMQTVLSLLFFLYLIHDYAITRLQMRRDIYVK